MDVRADLPGATSGLDGLSEKDLYLRLIRGRYLFTGQNSADHTGHNDFEILGGNSPECLVLVSGLKAISQLVYLASHTFLHYSMREKKSLSKLLQMEEVKIPQCFSSLVIGTCTTQDVVGMVSMPVGIILIRSHQAMI